MIFAFTSDVDFVSDAVIKRAYVLFNSLPLTVFQTGKSLYLEKAFKNENRWEAQVHPNFCHGSTHGSTADDVFDAIKGFAGEGTGYRCHRYFTSNDIAEKFKEMGYVYSSNVCTDLELIPPFTERCRTIQFPIFMEDGGYLKYHGVPQMNDIKKKLSKDGLYVFNFHPVHLALNSCDFSAIRNLKDSLTPAQYNALTEDDILKYRNSGYGMMNFLTELISYAEVNNIRLMNLKECYEEYKNVCV